ncbi:GNAT family N-acetyltransferase [Streptomyces sp. NPDC059070]|uniref:GNAT family N-acetyltransferase n=1 Tax=Streptomyces sp. NPDC059070 TaxID=3346713 RepID=UPI0036A60286
MSAARIDLEPLRAGHADEMADVLGDPALHRFTGGAPYARDELRARYERLAAGSPDPAVHWLNWVVRLRWDGRPVGTVQATVEGAAAEVAWVIGTPWQGRGYATEAARALVAGLAAHGVRRVVAHIHPDHTASAAVARAAGLAPTRERRDGEVRWSAGPGG